MVEKERLNQDYVFATDETIGNLPNLLVVADGMGGHRAGDFASRFTVEVLAEEVQNSKETHPEQILGNAIQTANERLMEEAAKDSRLGGNGDDPLWRPPFWIMYFISQTLETADSI